MGIHAKNYKKFYKAVLKQMLKKRRAQEREGSFRNLTIVEFLKGSLKKDLIDECVDKFIRKKIDKNVNGSLKKRNVPKNFFYK